MSRWKIYTKSGADRLNGNGEAVYAESLEYHGQLMDERFLTVTVRSAYPIAFASGDYITYRGEKFELPSQTTAIKKARRGTYGEGFTYDGIKFVSVAHELSECDFNDYVSYDDGIHFSSLTAFSFFCSSARDLADRIQANLNRIFGTGENYPDTAGPHDDEHERIDGGWRILVHPNICTDTSSSSSSSSDDTDVDGAGNEVRRDISLSVSGLSCWDALLLVKEKFGTVFTIQGRTVYIGYEPSVIRAQSSSSSSSSEGDYTFEYGKGNGLYEIEKTVDNSQKIITRLKGYGSTRNLPMRYYANIDMVAQSDITSVVEEIDEGDSVVGAYLLDLKFDKKFFKRPSAYTGFEHAIVKVKTGNVEVNAIVRNDPAGSIYTYLVVAYGSDVDQGDEPSKSNAEAFLAAAEVGAGVVFTEGIYKDKVPTTNKHYANTYLANNLAVQNLMLPGFPTKALSVWVAENVGTMSGGTFVPASGHIEGENFDIIKKAVEDGFTFSENKQEPYILSPNSGEYGIREASVYFDGSSDDQPEIFPTIAGTGNDDVKAKDTVTDNGIFPEGEEVPDFFIQINPGFRVPDYWQEGMTIAFNTGFCGGRSFEVSGVETVTGGYKLKLHRSYDSAIDLWFPYSFTSNSQAYHINVGDKYVLLDIEMPAEYVEANAVTLLAASIEYLRKFDHVRYTYLPKIDEIQIARERAASQDEQDSLYWKMREGSVMKFYDQDLGIDKEMQIDSITIREYGNANIPTFDVVLKEDEQQGILQELSKKVDWLAGTSGGNVSSKSSGGGSGTSVDSFWEEVTDEDGNPVAKLKDKYAGAYTNGFLSALGISSMGGGGGGGVTLNEPLLSINSANLGAPTANEDGMAIVWDKTLNSGQGGWKYGAAGGGTDLSAVWDSLTGNSGDYQNTKINAAHIPIATSENIGGIKVGTTLAISSGVLNQKSGIVTTGTYTKVTVDTYGRVTSGSSLSASDIPSLPASKITSGTFNAARIPDLSNLYLPLSGGTMTGQITGSKGGWWAVGRYNATVKQTGGTSTGWAPVISLKTNNGSYELGTIGAPEANQDKLILTYVDDDDYQTCIDTQGQSGNVARPIYFPTTAGTLALLTDNVASATKLYQARSLWGNNFDGSANVNGLIEAANGLEVPSGKYIKIGSLYLTYDSINNAIRVSGSADGSGVGHFYATGAVSALGYSANGGGGGVTSLAQLSDVQLGTLSSGNVLMYNGSKWVNSSGFLPLSGGAMTGSLAMKGLDIVLATSGSSSDDSADLEWVYGNSQEKARIWFDNQYTATKGPNFLLYQKDGTQLYNGTLATVDSNVASATKLQTARKLWGNDFDGTAAVTGAIHLQNGNAEGLWIKDTGGTDRKVLGLDSGTTSSLQIGWDMRGYGTTNIHGNQVSFHVGAMSGGITAGNFSASGILHIARDLYLDTNNRGVVFTKSDGTTQVNGIYVDSGNNFVLGANMITSEMSSYLRGQYIRLQSGSTNADTLILDSNRNVIFAQNGSGLYSRDTSQENRNILQLNSQNVLAIGYGMGNPDYFTHLYGGSTNGISFYCYNTHVAGVQNKTANNVSVKGLYIGDGLIQWDSQNNALKILKKDGSAANLYATGGVSALGFQADVNNPAISSLTVGGRLTVGTGDNYMEYTASSPINDLKIRSTGYISLYANSDASRVYVYSGSLYASNIVEGNTIQATQKVTSPKFYFDSTRYLEFHSFSPASGVTVQQLRFYDGENYKVVKFE